jgi:hypothetical protein
MTLDETVLRKIADWHPAPGSRQILPVADEGSGWAATLTVDRHDELSSALWEIDLQCVVPAPSGVTLTGWAHGVPTRVTGLLEPLRVVEIDSQRNEALLRSHEPSGRNMDLFYYEVLLKGTRAANVRRYKASRDGGHREQVPFALTHEVLAKFVGDLADSQRNNVAFGTAG